MGIKVTLNDGRLIKLKLAEHGDFKGVAFDSMYAWYQQIDNLITISYKPENYNIHKKMLTSQLVNKNISVIIGIHDNKIIAQISLFQNEPNIFQKISHVAGFLILIHPEFQNVGLGTAMIKMIEDIAILRGIRKIEIICIAENEHALHVYEKLGYLREGYHPKSVQLKNGKHVAKISLGKQLIKY
ncbi:MAG: GNAT family N-acetyltransferase [Candidatus Lokiarchaeota archaeon]|nr:GNAT family N-acetyltransferase [Candidatus Lokiarchaeota archaeon]